MREDCGLDLGENDASRRRPHGEPQLLDHPCSQSRVTGRLETEVREALGVAEVAGPSFESQLDGEQPGQAAPQR